MIRALFVVLIAAYAVASQVAAGPYIPVVLMHGVAQGNDAMAIVVDWLQESMPGVYVVNMEIGNGLVDSIFMHMDDQIQTYCNNVRADPNLANGFNAIGFSQGTLITRGYIERCNSPPVFNYIAWCGPQDGQFGTPYVNIPWIDEILATIPYSDWAQKSIAPAQYWKDPLNYEEYLEKATLLPDLNNERAVKNETYRQNMLSLKNLVLVYGSADTVIRPQQSAWFYFFANNSQTEILTMEEQPIYYEDWLGFKTLNETDRLTFYSTNCTHYEHHTPVCKYNFVEHTLPYLQ
jgi:palmitoyl-protein thioesterase